MTDGPDDKLSFWNDQAIKQSELLTLIEADRVRIIHSQAEERGDLGFLREAHEANSIGVIGRRKTTAMMVSDIVETADEYLLGKHSLANELPILIDRLSEEFNVPRKEIAKVLLFPQHMRRACLGPFMDRGLMGLGAIGQGQLFSKIFERARGKEVGLEATYFGQSMHIAHMLDATFVSHRDDSGYVDSWIGPARAMGDFMNFYRSLNSRIAPAWIGNERRKVDRHSIFPAIPLIDFHDSVTFQEILDISNGSATRFRGQGLISRLSQLPIDERERELESLNSEYAKIKSKRLGAKSKILIADAIVGVGTYALDLSLFPIVPALTLLTIALKTARKAPSLDVIISEIELTFEEQTGKNSDLTFASKISRIADIRSIDK